MIHRGKPARPESETPMNAEKKFALKEKARLMSASEIERTLVRLAHEIVEKANGVDNLGPGGGGGVEGHDDRA